MSHPLFLTFLVPPVDCSLINNGCLGEEGWGLILVWGTLVKETHGVMGIDTRGYGWMALHEGGNFADGLGCGKVSG
jgi:hypothetical protein